MLITNATMLGRMYGQGVMTECLFDVITDFAGLPMINVRVRMSEIAEFTLPHGTYILVQLFEQPTVLWLAHAMVFQDQGCMITYAPIEPLQSADDRSQMPDLATVTHDQAAEGLRDALDNQGGMWRET